MRLTLILSFLFIWIASQGQNDWYLGSVQNTSTFDKGVFLQFKDGKVLDSLISVSRFGNL